MTAADTRTAAPSGEDARAFLDRAEHGDWRGITPTLVYWPDVIETQWPGHDEARLAELLAGRAVEGDDPYPHLIAWRGGLYMWDGHHRRQLALRRGQLTGAARVLDFPREARHV